MSKGLKQVLFVSTGLKGHFGGTAFSEALLCGELQKSLNISLWIPKGRLDRAFLQEFSSAVPTEINLASLLLSYLNAKHPLATTLKNSNIVHLNGHWSLHNVIIGLLCRRYVIPYVIHPRGMLWVGHRSLVKKKVFNWLFGYRLIRNAKTIIALSRFETRTWSPYRIPPQKIEVIANPVVTNGPAKDVKAQKFSYLLYLGRIEPRKNLNFLLNAYRAYLSQGGKLDLRLVGPEEKNEIDKLKQLPFYGSIASKVFFEKPVFRSDKGSLISQATALVYPSLEEAFGRVPFESLSYGTPCFVPTQSGASEYFEKKFPELIYKEEVSYLASRLYQAESFNREHYQKQGPLWIEEEFSAKKSAERVLSTYFSN